MEELMERLADINDVEHIRSIMRWLAVGPNVSESHHVASALRDVLTGQDAADCECEIDGDGEEREDIGGRDESGEDSHDANKSFFE